jgi:hypothetical protein
MPHVTVRDRVDDHDRRLNAGNREREALDLRVTGLERRRKKP